MARRLSALAAAALCLLVAACGSSGDGGGGRASDVARAVFEATEPSSGEVRISGPKVVASGPTEITLRNSGLGLHDAQLIHVSGRRSVDEVISNTIDAASGAPFPEWVLGGGGLGTVQPGESATVTEVLEPGTYYLLDSERAHGGTEPNARRGGVAQFEVVGGRPRDELPETDAVVTARDYRFETTGIQSGRNRVTFENDGTQLHQMIALPLVADATLRDAKRFLIAKRRPRGTPPVDLANAVRTAAIDGGQRQIAELDFAPGRYALVCFVTNRVGGPSHLAQGMIDELDVSDPVDPAALSSATARPAAAAR